MSLIADALKAAQEERRDHPGRAVAAERRRVAASALRTSASLGTAAVGHAGFTRPVWISLAMFGAALAGAAILVARVPPAGGEFGGRPVPPPLESPAVAFRPGALAGGNPEIEGDPGAPIEESVDTNRWSPEEAVWREIDYSAGTAPVLEPGIDEAEPAAPASGPGPAPFQPDPVASTTWPAASDPGPAASTPEPAASAPELAASDPGRAAVPEGRFQLTIQDPPRATAGGFDEALAAQRRGDFRTAISLYESVLERQPAHAEALNNLGTSFQALGDLDRARTSFEAALRAQPAYAPAWSNLGVVLGSLGREDESLAALTEAVRLDPGNAGARVNLGLLYQRRGMAEEAARVLEAVLRLDPDHAEAQYAYARLLEQRGDRDGAVRHYRLFLANAGARFPHLEGAVRQRIDLLGRADERW